MLPEESTRVIKADLALIGSFGGALLVLPKDVIAESLSETPLDEVLRDAMHEVMKIYATFVCLECRAVFRTMFTEAASLPEAAVTLVRGPKHMAQYRVTVTGYSGGAYSMMI